MPNADFGKRESGTERLEEAVMAYHEALKEHTRERVPLDWAMTQNNLGTALQSLGERESGTERLEEAVAAYHEALKEYTREGVPLNWATTQNNLGSVLRVMGERRGGTEQLKEAVRATELALDVYCLADMSEEENEIEAKLLSLNELIAQRLGQSA